MISLKNLIPFRKKSQPETRRPASMAKRKYNSAALDRLVSDWVTSGTSADAEISPTLSTLRNRARDLERNSDYVRRFFHLLRTNVVGHRGVALQMKTKNPDGTRDKYADRTIETFFKEWTKKGNCTVCGGYSFIDVQKHITTATARDGEALIRFITYPNKFNFALQIIEADHLDHTYNTTLINGNRAKMGVELDKWGRPVAYYLVKNHPGEHDTYSRQVERERVHADEILHIYVRERAGQTRGVTWIASPAARLKILDGYEEATLVASRVAAATMGFVTPGDDGDGYLGSDINEEEEDFDETVEEDDEVYIEAEPGVIKGLPRGSTFNAWDPKQPHTSFSEFVKAILRGIASGLNVSYVALANDLEGVSYSSIRQGEMSDRDHWKMLQTWIIEHALTAIFEKWLVSFLTVGLSNLPMTKFDKFNAPVWRPRGWSWVDPDKESKAATNDVKNGFRSLQNVNAERGLETEDVLAENAEARDLAKQYNLNLPIFQTEAHSK